MAKREIIDMWTVVQHSAFAAKGDYTFRKGLESAHIRTKADRTKVEKAGGLLFETYGAAEDFAESAMFPQGYMGMVPKAQGTFAGQDIDGRAIYVPVREVTVVG